MTNQKGITQILAAGLILSVAVVLLAAVILYQKSGDTQKEVAENINASAPAVVTNTNTDTVTNTSTANTNTTIATNTSVTLTGSTTESVDATWNKYTNNDLGFSINIPNQAWFFPGGCEYVTDSYQLQTGPVNVLTFEGTNSVFIAEEYLYELDANGDCNILYNDFTSLSNNTRTWHMMSATVSNDTMLNNFVSDNFGTGGCTAGAQTPSATQAGVFDVAVDSGGPESECFLNYNFVIKYYPDGNKVITWDLGQASAFNTQDFDPFDPDMTSSFMFIE